jgi:hypothetical protein
MLWTALSSTLCVLSMKTLSNVIVRLVVLWARAHRLPVAD